MQEYYVEVRTANYKEYLYSKLSDLRSKEGLPIDIYELKNDAQYLVRCVYSTLKGRREQDRLIARIYNYYFARALAEIIFQGWEGVFIEKILRKEYRMTGSDAEEISGKAWRNLNREDQTYLPETRKHVLVKSILEFLDSHDRFDIEGFMNFRADLYKKELRKQIARAVNEYTLEQEHDSFVQILKRFLASQHSVYKTMHLVIKAQGEVNFFDDKGRNINYECLGQNAPLLYEATPKGLSEGKAEGKISNVELYEDFLISSILKCAPRRLIVHAVAEQHPAMIRIIQQVFEEKVTYCEGCLFCQEFD
jgi:putative sporulation protein YtxC